MESLELLLERGSHISMPLARYIMCSYNCIPVATIIVGERPYASDILPYAASAMSYDYDKNPEGTPSTITLGTDISNKYDVDADLVEQWFRDSWKYLRCGVFLVNVCCFTKFMGKSLYERTCIEEFLRDMIYVSLLVGRKSVHVFPMGNPAQHSVNRIRSSVPSMRERVKVHSCPNPASLSHKRCDLRSQSITLNKPGVSRLLFETIKSTVESQAILTEYDYYTMSSGPSGELSTVTSKGNRLADEFASVEEYFKSGAAANTDPSGEEVFRKAKEATAQFVMVINNAKIGALFSTMNEPPNVAKGAFKSRDRGYVAKKFERGTSSNVSSKSTPIRKAEPENIGFADDDDEQPGIMTPATTDKSIPVPTTPRTPVNKRSPPTATNTTTSNKSVPVGFVDEDSGEDAGDAPVAQTRSLSVSSEDVLTSAEIESITYVSDFIDDNSEYNFPGSVSEEIHECLRTKRASADRMKALAKSIRISVANGDRDAFDALGYKNKVVDMGSPILKWVVSQAE